jgi:hypothetical protein
MQLLLVFVCCCICQSQGVAHWYLCNFMCTLDACSAFLLTAGCALLSFDLLYAAVLLSGA